MRVGIIASERSCLGRWALTAQLSPAPTTPPPPPWSFRLPHGSRPGSQFLTFVSLFFSLLFIFILCVCETADRRFTTHDSLLHTAIERRKTKQQKSGSCSYFFVFFFKSFSHRLLLLLLLDFDFSGSLSVNGRLSHTHSHTRKTKLA